MNRILLIIITIAASLIILISGAYLIGNMLFNRQVQKEITAFFDGVEANPANQVTITQQDLAHLPPVVQKWLQKSQVVGKPRINSVYLTQEATLRLNEDQSWMPAQAEQYFKIVEPGFIWKTNIRMHGVLPIVGRDMYQQGKGHMLIKILSLLPVANAKGPEIDQGTLLRYMGEMSWFPTAALSDYMQWEQIDSNTAKATMTYGGITATGVFTFNDEGLMTSFSAARYMEKNGHYSLEDWVVKANEHKELSGIIIPNQLDVIWQLDSGDFHWFSCEITDIEYNTMP